MTTPIRALPAVGGLALLLSLGAGLPAAHAAEGGDTVWGVQPSSEQGPDGRGAFDYVLAPGETVTDYVGVSNLGAGPISVRVYAMDASTTTDGAFTLPPAGTESVDVGSWVGLGDGDVFEIAPGTRLDIPFRLTVPPDASPGDHAGGIVASLSELSTTGEGAQQVAVDRRVGARVYVTVPGEQLPALEVTDVSVAYDGGWNLFGGTATVSYTVANPGNMRVAGSTRLALDGPFGWRLADLPATESTEILPGASVRVEEEFTGIVPAVLLTASAELAPEFEGGAAVDGEHRASGTGWAIPYPIALVLLALLAIAGLAIWRRLRARRAARSTGTTAPTGAEASADAPAEGADAGAADGRRADDRDLVDAH
ncbi:DUF916 domain-containing protein [Agromyces sp. LHK192]|uniref:DUF916 domain-containing protein n=1 Tax=Agromyces sp. LHK192 TaxID=2498704 RepID=UPI000FDAC1DC|nr:DUF916 domain-containing protein [Agromyces sp. LHK192]